MYLEEWRNNGRELTGTVTTSATRLTEFATSYTGSRVSVLVTNTGAVTIYVKWNKSSSAPTITSTNYYTAIPAGQQIEFAARSSDIELWAITASGSSTFVTTEIR